MLSTQKSPMKQGGVFVVTCNSLESSLTSFRDGWVAEQIGF